MKKYIIVSYAGEARLIISAGSFIHHDKGLVVMHGSTSLDIPKSDRGVNI